MKPKFWIQVVCKKKILYTDLQKLILRPLSKNLLSEFFLHPLEERLFIYFVYLAPIAFFLCGFSTVPSQRSKILHAV